MAFLAKVSQISGDSTKKTGSVTQKCVFQCEFARFRDKGARMSVTSNVTSKCDVALFFWKESGYQLIDCTEGNKRYFFIGWRFTQNIPRVYKSHFNVEWDRRNAGWNVDTRDEQPYGGYCESDSAWWRRTGKRTCTLNDHKWHEWIDREFWPFLLVSCLTELPFLISHKVWYLHIR